MERKVIQPMPIDRIERDPQVRTVFDTESDVGLALSIAESGIHHALDIKREGGRFVVVDGERRLRAAIRAGLTEVPVVINDRELGEGATAFRQLLLNHQRAPLVPLDFARGVDVVMKACAWSKSDIARKLGVSPATITRSLALLTLPESILKRVESGEITADSAYRLSQIEDVVRQTQLADEAADGRLTRDHIAKQVHAHKSRRRAPPSRRKTTTCRERVSLRLAADCTMTIIGKEINVERAVAWLKTLVDRLALLETQDMALKDAVERLAFPSG